MRDGGGGSEARIACQLTPVQEAKRFADTVDDFASLITCTREFGAFLLDLAENGQINDPKRRETVEKLKVVLEEALV